MPKRMLNDDDAYDLREDLHARGFKHLRVRKHAETLVIESGDKLDPIPHARLRRDTVHLWILEMPTHTGRWQVTPFRLTLPQQLELLVTELSWALASFEPMEAAPKGRRERAAPSRKSAAEPVEHRALAVEQRAKPRERRGG